MLPLVAVLLLVVGSGGEVHVSADSIHWLGHDAFRIDGPPVVYIDPFQLAGDPPQADLILVTHDHFDHLSPDDLAKVRGPKTVVVGPHEVAAKLAGVETMAVGETRTFAGVTVKAVPAYNTNKKFHPKADGKLGYVVTVGGLTIYHAGDSDDIPEMAGLAPDVALLPVSGTYVMTAAEAAAAAKAIRPRLAIPMHYGAIVGSDADATTFAKLLAGSGIEVVIKARE